MIETIKVKNGEIIFKEGEIGDCMYEILDGNVDIILGYGNINEKRLISLENDKIFGEMGLLEKSPRSATAISKGTTVLRKITPENINEFIVENPGKVLMLMQATSRRIRELTNSYVGVSTVLSAYQAAKEKNEPISKDLLNTMKAYAKKR